MILTQVTENKKAHLPLLLLADPEEAMIDRYLEQGELWTLADGGAVIAVAVVMPLDGGLCELKNLAVDEAHQNCGYGTYLVQQLAARYARRYKAMLVGTADAGTAYYEKLGFTYHHTVSGFFTDNYSEPIWDKGQQCIDMIYLSLPL